jgi:hypothetical protein
VADHTLWEFEPGQKPDSAGRSRRSAGWVEEASIGRPESKCRLECGGSGGSPRAADLDQAELGELGTGQDRAEDALLDVRAAASRQIQVGHIGPYDLAMGVEKEGVELGQARATTRKGDEEEHCTEPAENPNHASSLGS